MAVKTDAISFPNSARGLEQITQTLVTNFGDQYENVRTFCLSRPNSEYLPLFRCDWLVGMSARQGGAVRVGCGHYGWHFGPDTDGRVKKLVIDIEVMGVLSAGEVEPVMKWLAALPYPWCSKIQARSIRLLDLCHDGGYFRSVPDVKIFVPDERITIVTDVTGIKFR